jgi:hypothetical protein
MQYTHLTVFSRRSFNLILPVESIHQKMCATFPSIALVPNVFRSNKYLASYDRDAISKAFRSSYKADGKIISSK